MFVLVDVNGLRYSYQFETNIENIQKKFNLLEKDYLRRFMNDR